MKKNDQGKVGRTREFVCRGRRTPNLGLPSAEDYACQEPSQSCSFRPHCRQLSGHRRCNPHSMTSSVSGSLTSGDSISRLSSSAFGEGVSSLSDSLCSLIGGSEVSYSSKFRHCPPRPLKGSAETICFAVSPGSGELAPGKGTDEEGTGSSSSLSADEGQTSSRNGAAAAYEGATSSTNFLNPDLLVTPQQPSGITDEAPNFVVNGRARPSPLQDASRAGATSGKSSNSGFPEYQMAAQDDAAWINRMAPTWHAVDPIWQASLNVSSDVIAAAKRLSPPWRLLLLGDGSVTMHLQLLLGHEPSVKCWQMQQIGHSLLGLPPGTALVPGPRLQRQVVLCDKKGRRLVYAASWWAAEEVKAYLWETESPVWSSLAKKRTEVFRDLQRVYFGPCPPLEEVFGVTGPFWARYYLFIHNGRPLTLIYEVFSPALDGLLRGESFSDNY